MSFIKTSGISCCLLLLGNVLAAQDPHTLYYSNGQKALEGRWTYAASVFQRTNLVEAALAGMEQRDDDDDGPESRRSSRWSAGYQVISQSLRCEGLVTAYYLNGNKRSEVRYKKGIATGACTTYYSNGSKAWQGELSNGMRTGVWTGWYRDGKLCCQGSFEPLGQEQLEETWRSLFGSGRSRQLHERPSDLLENSYSDTATATNEQRDAFKQFEGQAVGSAETHIVFFQKNGDTLASISLQNGLREGQWKLRRGNLWQSEPGGGRQLVLEYRRGRLLAITDDSGRHSIGAYVTAWKKNQQRVMQRPYPNDGPGTGAGDPNGVDPGLAAPIVEAPSYPYPAYRYARADNRPAIFPGPGDMGEWIRSHLQYPASALRDSTYGSVTVALLLSAEGKRTDVFIQNSSGHAGLDAEALRVVKTLPDFHPATSNGKKVRSLLSVNVSFENPAYRRSNVAASSAESGSGSIEVAVDRPATFPDLYNYLSTNIVYPAEARQKGQQGKVFVQFVVNLNGSLSDVKVARSSGYPLLDAEAVRVIKNMPRWIPGQKGGLNVRSIFRQPVTFHF